MFEKRPLDQALRSLALETGFSIVLDTNRAGERAQAHVTARFRGIGLENAVRVLADQAELKSVLVDKVLYVTTPENAELLQKEEERRLKAPEKPAKETGKEEDKKETPKKDDKGKAK